MHPAPRSGFAKKLFGEAFELVVADRQPKGGIRDIDYGQAVALVRQRVQDVIQRDAGVTIFLM